MKILICIGVLLLLLITLVFIMLKTAEGFGDYRGVGRWDSKTYSPWIGTSTYPVSKNCNCPDNHDFVDNKCISRDYPFKVSTPFCYNSIE